MHPKAKVKLRHLGLVLLVYNSDIYCLPSTIYLAVFVYLVALLTILYFCIPLLSLVVISCYLMPHKLYIYFLVYLLSNMVHNTIFL